MKCPTCGYQCVGPAPKCCGLCGYRLPGGEGITIVGPAAMSRAVLGAQRLNADLGGGLDVADTAKQLEAEAAELRTGIVTN